MKRALISALLGLLVFATGATALVYQVLLERYLARLVGSDHVAAGLTLAAFLGGLAAGYVLCGRWTLVSRRPLRTYALLEGAIGLWALLFPAIFAAVERGVASWSFSQPWGLLFQGMLVASVLVVPPTLVMGATVPFLTRALAGMREDLSSLHAGVYAINTAGAFVGVLAAGFLLVPRFGLPVTMRGAACLNLVAGLLLLGLAGLAADPSRAVRLAGLTRHRALDEPRFSTRLLTAVALINGCAVLLLESASIRLGKLVLGSSTYTFSMVVAVFVLSLALGSAWVARARRLPAGLLWAVQSVAGLLLVGLYLVLDLAPYATHLLRVGFASTAVGFWLYHVALLAGLLAVLGLPVALLGMTIPVLFHELGARVERAGWVSGRLLGWNGLGTLLGSLGGSFLLYHWLDSARIFLLAPWLAFLSALLVARPLGRPGRAVATLLLAGATLLLALVPFHEPDRFAAGMFRTRQPLPYSLHGPRIFHEEHGDVARTQLFEEGPVAAVALLEGAPRQPGEPPGLAMYVNGKSESSTWTDAETLRLLAHLPALWAERRESVLVIGLGTGVTVGEFSLYDDVESIRVAEISPTVAAMLPRFADATHQVHRDPRLDLRVQDAWLALRERGRDWDVISAEASNPWVTGVDSLFTREFYVRVRSRLNPGGLFVQWTHLYECDFEMLAIVLNSLTAEFPVVHAFRGTEGDLLLLASARPLGHADATRARETLAQQPGVADSLAEIGIDSIGTLLKREVTTLPTLLKQAEPYGFNTLDHPRLHYLAGRHLFLGSRVDDDALRGVVDVDFLFDPDFRRRFGSPEEP